MTKISDYERSAIDKLGQTIHDGKWSNEGLVQLIELAATFLQIKPIQQYANENNISYNGAKKREEVINILGHKYIIDNE